MLQIVQALEVEEREFLFEMVEPELLESQEVLANHNKEELIDFTDVEDWTNTMGRQKRRMEFLKDLHSCLERNLSDG